MLHLHLGDLPGVSIYFILILHTVHDELHFVFSVIKIILFFYELQVIPLQLGGKQTLSGLRVDVPFFAVDIVIVILIQRDGTGADLIGLHRGPDRLGQFIEELLAGVYRTPGHLQHDVLFVSVNGGIEVAIVVDPAHQLADDGHTGITLISGVAAEYGLAVGIQGVEFHHVASVVVGHLDFRVDAQQHAAYGGVVACVLRNGRRGGRSALSGGSAAFSSAGGQQGKGEDGGESQSKQIHFPVLFHVVHLLSDLLCFIFCVLCFTMEGYGPAGWKPGSTHKKFFLFSWAMVFFHCHRENTRQSSGNRGRDIIFQHKMMFGQSSSQSSSSQSSSSRSSSYRSSPSSSSSQSSS